MPVTLTPSRMRTRLRALVEQIRSSLWFLPAVLAALAVLTALLLVEVDQAWLSRWMESHGWARSGGPEAATAIMSTIAGSMITIGGVVFSMTLVALSLASSQFGPRLLKNFMRDRSNQFVLGVFIATFAYCTVVLSSIRHGDTDGFVPQFSMLFGLLMALASLGFFIYFIHHVATSVQGNEVIARVMQDIDEGIDRAFPKTKQAGGDSVAPAAPDNVSRLPVHSTQDGYLQQIDFDALVCLAKQQDVVFTMACRPGHYRFCGQPLVWIADPAEGLNDGLEGAVNAAMVFGNQRTPTQDLEFSIDQLVEIAARALSPGVNDPFTAIACIDRLGSAFARIAQRPLPANFRRDEAGGIRLILQNTSHRELLDAAFHQIRQSARSNVAVSIRLLDVLDALASMAPRETDRAALRAHAELVLQASQGIPDDADRSALAARYRASSALQGSLAQDERIARS